MLFFSRERWKFIGGKRDSWGSMYKTPLSSNDFSYKDIWRKKKKEKF